MSCSRFVRRAAISALLLVAAAFALSAAASPAAAAPPRQGCGPLTLEEETAALNNTTGTQGLYFAVNVTLCDLDEPSSNLTAMVVVEPATGWSTQLNATGDLMIFSTSPTNEQVGHNWFNVSICDSGAACTVVSFHLWIANVNDAPDIQTLGDPRTLDQGQAFFLLLDVVDADDQRPGAFATVFTYADDTSLFDIQSNGTISFTPTNGQVGNWLVQIFVWDDATPQLSDTLVLTITVVNVNDPPALPPYSDITVTQDQAFTAPLIKANDPDLALFDRLPQAEQEALVYTDNCPLFDIVRVDQFNLVTGQPEPAGQIRIVATNTQVGDWTCNITVTDLAGASDTIAVSIHVSNVNDPPTSGGVRVEGGGATMNITVENGKVTFDEATPLILTVLYSDPDLADRLSVPGTPVDPNEAITCSVLVTFVDGGAVPPTAAPTKPTVDTQTCKTLFTPGNNEVGTFSITYTLRDTSQASATFRVRLEILNVNNPPTGVRTLAPSDGFALTVGDLVSLAATAVDIDTPDSLLLYLWTIEVNGSVAAQATGKTASWNTSAAGNVSVLGVSIRVLLRVVDHLEAATPLEVAGVGANGTLYGVEVPEEPGPPPVEPVAITSPAIVVNNSTSISVAFSINASGGVPPYTYLWDFGDGTTSTAAAPVHVYAVAGSFNATVTVTDAAGNSTTRTIPVTVAAAPSLAVSDGSPLALWLLGLAVAGAILGAAIAGTQPGRYFVLFAAVGSVFGRLHKPSPLDHFVRGRLYQLIELSPGIHYSELRRQAKLANGLATHHLRVLEHAGIIRVIIDGTRTRFYPTDKPLTDESYGLTDRDRTVLETVVAAPGISQTELSRRLEASLPTVGRSVDRLAALGYVVTRREGRLVTVFPREGVTSGPPSRPVWPDEGA